MTATPKRITTVVDFDDGTFVKFEIEDPRYSEFGCDIPDLDVILGGIPAEALHKMTPPKFTSFFVNMRSGIGKPINIEWGVTAKEPIVWCGIVGCKGHTDAIETCAVFMAVREG